MNSIQFETYDQSLNHGSWGGREGGPNLSHPPSKEEIPPAFQSLALNYEFILLC